MYIKEVGRVDVRWMELNQDRVEWWSLVLAVWNLPVLLPQSWCVTAWGSRNHRNVIFIVNVAGMERQNI
jgi:hypothetical protein